MELARIEIESRQGAHRIGVARELGVLGAGLGNAIFVGYLAIVPLVHSDAVGRADVAGEERVLVFVGDQRDVLGLALELGELERERELGRRLQVGPHPPEEIQHRVELGLAGQLGEAAHDAGDGMDVPAHEDVAEVVADGLHAKRATHDLLVRVDERHEALDAQEIGRDEEVDVEDMAVEDLEIEEELAEPQGLIGRDETERVLGGLDRCQGVAAGADAADTRGDVLGLEDASAAEHAFEESRRLHDVEPGPLEPALPGVDDDVAVTLDARQVLDLDIDGLSHGSCPRRIRCTCPSC